jgi:crotonobetainyl-CoA:carnitine CoA-transferase CaiB-like acyl-CoA transferase
MTRRCAVQPLEKLRVIDFTHALAGPFCTHHLQLLGADVIKVEPPGRGDDFRERPPVFAAVNSGKRSVALDLATPHGQKVLRRLIETADVVVENFRPGVNVKLGLEWEKLKAINPRLIFCSISGYGQEGPLRDMPAIEWSVQAISGLSASYVDESAPPMYLGLGMLDPYSGYVAFSAILAALLQRQQTGIGQRIDVGMLDAALVIQSAGVANYTMTGSAERFNKRPSMARYRAKDKRIFIAALTDKWFATLCEVMGVPDLARDPRFIDHAARMKHADAFVAAIEAQLASRPAEEWEKLLVARGVPAGAVRTLAEIVDHPHVAARGLIGEVKVPDREQPVRVAGAGFRFAHGGPGFHGPVPRLGEHTDEVLREIGMVAEAAE